METKLSCNTSLGTVAACQGAEDCKLKVSFLVASGAGSGLQGGAL